MTTFTTTDFSLAQFLLHKRHHTTVQHPALGTPPVYVYEDGPVLQASISEYLQGALVPAQQFGASGVLLRRLTRSATQALRRAMAAEGR